MDIYSSIKAILEDEKSTPHP